jgi:hypothetical protein
MIDTRLLGTWQSDWRKTAQEARARCRIPPEKRKKLKLLFGKLCVRFTRTRIYSEFGGEKSVAPYRVAAKDAHSVAILAPGLLDPDEQEIYHIHFEGRYYWIWPAPANFPEYFRGIE